MTVFSNEKILKAKKSVVTIHTVQDNEQTWNPFQDPIFNMFFDHLSKQSFETVSSGSGTVISYRKKKFILTCYHVVKGAKNDKVRITLFNGKRFWANICQKDAKHDLALLNIPDQENTNDLESLHLGTQEQITETEEVYAIGNGAGIGVSVVNGIISAFPTYDGNVFLQTTVGINPGNSGGGLLNKDGELIGVPNAILIKPNVIGFCIPIARVLKFLNQDQTQWSLGIKVSQIDDDQRLGVKISYASDDSPLKNYVGSIITSFNGSPIHKVEELLFYEDTLVNSKVNVELELPSKERKEVSVALIKAPLKKKTVLTGVLKGMEVEEINGLVTVIERGDGPYSNNFEEGDIITILNNTKIDSVKTIQDVLTLPSVGLSFTIQRGNGSVSFSVGQQTRQLNHGHSFFS
jgi:S1-C subfamily serine protease